MNATSSRVYLIEASSGDAVDAELLDQIGEDHVRYWEDKWKPFHSKEWLEQAGIPPDKWPQSKHWDWRRKSEAIRGILAYPGFCLMCRDALQGLMIVNLTKSARLEKQKGKPLVYVEFLETAPWNRSSLQNPPTFRGVGSLLIRVAIQQSIDQGFKGRLGLHSLPQANPFYADTCGMSDLGTDPNHQELRYYEMTPEQANVFINRGNS
jgi:hypothetical protein